MKLILAVSLSLFLAGCVQYTTPESAEFVRISCSGASGGWFGKAVGIAQGNTRYKQVTSSKELTTEDISKYLENYKCEDEESLQALRELLAQ